MTKELFIRMVENGKESELTVSNPTKESEQALLAGVLSFMDIKLDDNLLRIQQLYADFYTSETNHNFTEINEDVPLKNNENLLALSDNELFKRGMKRNVNDDIVYRCHYICPKCKDEGNHYIYKNRTDITCHNCKHKMPVRELPPGVSEDVYFHAGDYDK